MCSTLCKLLRSSFRKSAHVFNQFRAAFHDMEGEILHLRRLRQQVYVSAKRRETNTNLSQWTLQTALLVALLLNYDFAAGAEWLHQRRRRGTQLAEGSCPEQTASSLEDYFLESEVDELALWCDAEHSPLSRTVWKTACEFVQGHRLAQWVRQRNVQGAAVPVQTLVTKYNMAVGSDASGLSSVLPAPPPMFSSGRMWARRWRLKYGGRHAAVKVEDRLPVESLRQKVHTFFSNAGASLSRFWVRFRADFESQFWVPKLVPIFGTRI